MLFNSIIFLGFLILVVYIYYLLTPHYRRLFLLMTSYIFYAAWSVPFCFLLLFSTWINYIAAKLIDSMTVPRHRMMTLVVSLFVNLGILSFFKYANFFSDTVYSIFGYQPWHRMDIILPLGISFYTFELISYTIDVYRRQTQVRQSFLDVALYAVFFPHLIAGPIIRATQLMPQLTCHHSLDWVSIRLGIAQILWGMTKKVYIGDPMGLIVNEAYSAPEQVSGVGLLLATYAFAIQIYCDFSGYSDIAIGSARLIGINLPDNFNHPYLSCSIRDFWRRWHITLSSWLRDYLYISLGGNRYSTTRTYINLMITMLLGGLWHGAGWNWVVWGGLQGIMLSLERATGLESTAHLSKPQKWIRWFITFHLICLSWVFFRSDSLQEAILILQRFLNADEGWIPIDVRPLFYLGLLLLAERGDWRTQWTNWIERQPIATKWVTYTSVVILVFTFAGASNSEFIYFQF